MLFNYFKTAIRSLYKYRAHTLLNILGLAIGMSASILIFQYVVDEYSYDKFHVGGEHIYRVRYDNYNNAGERTFKCASVFPGVAPAMKADFPEVEAFARVYILYGGGVMRYPEKDLSFQEDLLFHAEQRFLDMFSYEWVAGDEKNALTKPNTAIISEELVEKYFGEEDPIGKRLKFGNHRFYEITGVMRSPEQSHFKFDFLFSYPTMAQWSEWAAQAIETDWNWYDFYTYVKLVPGTDVQALERKFPAFIAKHGGQDRDKRVKFSLQPLHDIHLYSDLIQEARINGDGEAISFLSIIALFILLIAWINYINLSTARAINRAREVGVRKVVGALKTQLVRQFLLEAILVNGIAAALALILVQVAAPHFANLAQKELSFSLLEEPRFWGILVACFVGGAVLSGIYPSLVLSAYKPVEVLYGRFQKIGAGLWLRKGLVVFQFAASIFLIASTIIVYKQLAFMRAQDLGYDIEQTMVIKGPGSVASDSVYVSGLNLLREELATHAEIKAMSASSEIPGRLIFWARGARAQGLPPEDNFILYKVGIDYTYLEAMGYRMLAGRTFSEDFSTDSRATIINEEAAKSMGWLSPEDALGKKVVSAGDTTTVVGVVANFHQEGLQKGFDPVAFLLRPNSRSFYTLKVNTARLPETIDYVQEKFTRLFPGNPFIYFFLDDFFDKQYQAEKQFAGVFSFFTILAILVACLGLIGLSAFAAAQRTKEIGIRRVLGSSIGRIYLILTRSFVIWVLLANLVAIPIAYMVMDDWLSSFAFRIEIPFWIFILSAVLALLIAIVTISYQVYRVATSNPVESLRAE